MIAFRITHHAVRRGIEIVEILYNGEVCAVMYPKLEEDGIKITSAHFDLTRGVRVVSNEGEKLPIPEIFVTFEPRPFRIEDGKIVRGEP